MCVCVYIIFVLFNKTHEKYIKKMFLIKYSQRIMRLIMQMFYNCTNMFNIIIIYIYIIDTIIYCIVQRYIKINILVYTFI